MLTVILICLAAITVSGLWVALSMWLDRLDERRRQSERELTRHMRRHYDGPGRGRT